MELRSSAKRVIASKCIIGPLQQSTRDTAPGGSVSREERERIKRRVDERLKTRATGGTQQAVPPPQDQPLNTKREDVPISRAAAAPRKELSSLFNPREKSATSSTSTRDRREKESSYNKREPLQGEGRVERKGSISSSSSRSSSNRQQPFDTDGTGGVGGVRPSGKRSSSNNRRNPIGKERVDKERESVDELERQILSKYGSSQYSLENLFHDEDDDEEDEARERRKGSANRKSSSLVGSLNSARKDPATEVLSRFEGFDPGKRKTSTVTEIAELVTGNVVTEESGGGVSSIERRRPLLLGRLFEAKRKSEKVSVDDNSNEDDNGDGDSTEEEEEEEDDGEGTEGSLKRMFSGKKRGRGRPDAEPFYLDDLNFMDDEDQYDNDYGDKEEELSRSGPLNLQQGFRLRPPKPITQEELDKIAQKEEQIKVREEQQKERRKEKRKLEESSFLPFDFTDSEVKSVGASLFTNLTFEEVGVRNKAVLHNLERMGLFNPTNIQAAAIPALRAGKDVLIQAQTGSGKTLAFLLPLLDVIDPTKRKVQAIVLAPSRELVAQIAIVAETLFKNTDIGVVAIIGGANVRNQIKRLREDRPQVVIATPGRLAEIVFGLERLRLGMVRAVIVDEVDNLLKDSYRGELQTILEATPLFSPSQASTLTQRKAKSQTIESSPEEDDGTDPLETEEEISDESEADESLQMKPNDRRNRLACFASATGGNDQNVRQFLDQLCGPMKRDSVEGKESSEDAEETSERGWRVVSVGNAAALPPNIAHGLISCPRIKALDMLRRFILSKPSIQSALIFVNEPHRVEIVCDKLLEMGLIAAPLHGETSKDDRKDILTRLREGRLQLVVSTELAARGIDIPQLTHVVNFELPTDSQHYVHRAGRCGRAGKPGLVINFATPDTKFVVRRFGKQLGVKVRDCEIRDGRVHLKQK